MAQDGMEILDLIPDVAIRVEGGKIVHLNTAATEFVGEASVGQCAEDVLPIAALDALDRMDPEPAACRHLDGTNRVVHWRVSRFGGGQLLLGRDVTGQVEATTALELQMRRLEALHSITLAVARGEDIGSICDIAFRSLAPIVSIVRGGVAALEGNDLRVFYHWNRGHSVLGDRRTVRTDQTPSHSCIVRRMPVQMRTTGSAALRWRQFRSLQRAGVRAVLYTPLIGGDRIFGLISLGTGDLAGFSPEDIEAVSEVAAQISAAMERSQLLARIEGNTEELERAVEERTAELERTTEQLVHAAKLSTLGELAAGLAHELSQPISVVSGHIELLRDDDVPEDREQRVLEIMGGAVERMGALTKKLTNYAKAQPEAIEPFDLRVAVDMALELSDHVEKNVEVRWERPPFPVEALGDVHRIEQVLINLLTNAQQATADAGGSVVEIVMGASEDGRAWVVVQDEGPGVPLDTGNRIFDPFFTTRKGGTGLGLAISARIVQEHGGSLALERSEQGARFRMVLNQA